MLSQSGRSLVAALVLAVGGFTTVTTAQDSTKAEKPKAKAEAAKSLKVGDKAPAIQVEGFIKGDAVTSFEAGKVYVVEFWATWCGPCVKAFPHLSNLQEEYKSQGVTFIGTNVGEDWRGTEYTAETRTKVNEFVTKKTTKMRYTVAYDGGTKFMENNWFKAAGQNGIPCAMVVDKAGKIAWIGHPMNLDYVLPDVVTGKWDYTTGPEKAEKAADAAQEKLQPIFQNFQSDPKEALKEFEKLEKSDPKALSMIEDMKMSLLFAAGEEEKGMALARKTVDAAIADQDAMPLNEIAWTIVDPEGSIKNKDLALALKAATKAVEFEPKDGTILDTLARVYWTKGDKAKAIELQEKAVGMTDNKRMKAQLQATLDEYNAGK